MESPSSAVRRRAWINSSRQRLTLEEHDSERHLCSLLSASTVDDDVFSDGCISGKIENWLLGCGSEVSSENTSQLSFEAALKAKHFDTELSLGADASLLGLGEILSGSGPSSFVLSPFSKQSHRTLLASTPRQALCLPTVNMGHSMASSGFSSSTSNSEISVLDILNLCTEDAEETLFELGFGLDEPQFNIRIPSRFFTFPSQAQGINFRLFLDSQLQRIRDEDPSLTLASRFRQVQVLTAMANAFFSLYSHVSRTPLQKLSPPEYNFYSSPVERMERFRSSIRSEPRSPVERLKDTVSKMCLYTGSPRGSESTSPQPSPKKRCSLSDGDFVQEKIKLGMVKKLNLAESNANNSTPDVRLGVAGPEFRHSGKEVPASETHDSGNKICCIENKNTIVDGHNIKAVNVDNKSQGERASLSLETGDRADSQFALCHLDPSGTKATTAATEEPLSCCSPKTNTASHICSETQHGDASLNMNVVSDSSTNPPGPLSVHISQSSFAQCCITLTGWQGEDISSCSLNTTGCHHASAVPAREESINKKDIRYLTPPIQQNQGSVSSNLHQVNSFELEELHSAGEDDFRTESETTQVTSLQSTERHHNEVVRGDSTHSDSSGYADEEISSTNP